MLALEKALGDCERAVAVRRRLVEERVGSLDGLPDEGYCYDQVSHVASVSQGVCTAHTAKLLCFSLPPP